MWRIPRRFGLVAGLLPLTLAVAACGSTSTTSTTAGTTPTTVASAGTPASGSANVATATAAVKQYTGHPTPFPVDQPLKVRPVGQTFAYLQCSTPVCGLFAQLLPPTASLLGYKLTVTRAGASASELQNAMSSIISEKPNGVLLTAITPDQFASQLRQAVQAKIALVANGVMNPQQYGIEAGNFDQRLSALAGKLLADQVISRHGMKANAVLYTIPELDFTSYVEKGYQAEMARLCPSCTNRYVPIPVATVGNTAPTRVVDDLQSHPDTKTAVFASEETVAGLPAALTASGLHVEITGFAPNPIALQYIKQGQVASGLGLDLAVMMWSEVDELARLTTHQPLTAGELAGDVPIQFLYKQDLPGDVSKGWTGYPDFPARFAKLWTGK
jgi:ribose transport system substrate-binding protein